MNYIYKLTISDSVILRNDGTYIPTDINNTEYKKYLIWLEEGGVPLPADE